MSLPAQQQEVAENLSRLSGGPPRETHISAGFIGADTVWKLKKAVRMRFLISGTGGTGGFPEARTGAEHAGAACNL